VAAQFYSAVDSKFEQKVVLESDHSHEHHTETKHHFRRRVIYRGRIINGGLERLILFLCLGMFWTGGTSYLSTQHGVMRFGIDGDHAASGSYLPSEVGRGRGTGFYL
jgi:hypothetical protein